MIKFEFTLNDVDASNLIGILHDEYVRAHGKARGIDSDPIPDYVDKWYSEYAGYVQSLKEKVLAGNKKVESETTEIVELNLSDSVFLTLARMAHEKDITINQMVNEILKDIVSKWNI
jgi:hypothetical protein